MSGAGTAEAALDPDFPLQVLRDLGTGVFTLDTEGRITYVNPWAQRLLGRTLDGMLGRDAHDLLHRRPDGSPVPREQCTMQTPLSSGRSAEEGSEEYFLRADGTTVPIIWSTTPLRLAGRVAGLVVVFSDFSLHRAAEERMTAHTAALEALTARLNLLADVSAVLMTALDSHGRMRRLLRVLVPELGDWAAVALYSELTGALEHVAVR
ncbi:PAS domain-containing protein, partial [Streptomyces sp. SID5998]|nr:PAS domain-containing protein [Streptomyces sp. SID5998]